MLKMYTVMAPERDLRPGEQLFAQGDWGDKCFIIQKGSIHLYHNQRLFAMIPQGEILGEMALIEENKRFATARAGKDGAKLYEISRDRFLKLVKERPEFSLEILKCMSNRLRTWGSMNVR
ncbi:MAG: Crp/Fnr family transcriptional regulator [Nitrospinota bacterium]|nr:Crp/Fnr family transcriptional regulator [Nitrospinota bacterium]